MVLTTTNGIDMDSMYSISTVVLHTYKRVKGLCLDSYPDRLEDNFNTQHVFRNGWQVQCGGKSRQDGFMHKVAP